MSNWIPFDSETIKKGLYWIARSKIYADASNEPIDSPYVTIGIWEGQWFKDISGHLFHIGTEYAIKPFEFLPVPELAMNLYKKDKLPHLLKQQKEQEQTSQETKNYIAEQIKELKMQ